MTRGKKLSVVFAVVILVVASGTALAMAASSNQANATNNVQAAQETTAATQTEQAAETASVSLSDQESEGTVITVDSVTLPEGGFVAIHDETLLDGDAIGSVIGVSRYLEPGTYEDLQIVLDRPISETQTLIAMPHQDTNENQAYGFIISDGNVDGPYVTGGAPVVSDAEITVSGEATEMTTEAGATEGATETEVATAGEPTETEAATETEMATETEGAATETEMTTEAVETEMTTEAPVTEAPATETPAAGGPGVPEQLVFRIENMQIDEWSFVVGDSTEPDRTQVITGGTLTDQTVELNLTELATGESSMGEAMGQSMAEQTTPETPEVGNTDTSDIETVRYVIRDVNVQNVTFVLTGLQQLQSMEELPEGVPTEIPGETTEMETTEVVETTQVAETTEMETTEAVEETTEAVETTEAAETTEADDTTEEAETTAAVETTEAAEPTEVSETTEEAETTEAAETTETGGTQAFQVEDLQAPDSASAGDVITVSATVTNPGDVENTERVDFRLQGDVIDSQTITLGPGESREVTFEIDTSQLEEGDYVHGVYGDETGQVAIITIDGESGTETETTMAARQLALEVTV